ncbi:MAG: ABC transporter C-terminal domain-containing protein [Allosphingosinicella sp.]
MTITLGLDGSGKVDIVAGGYEDWERKRSTQSSPALAGEGNRAKRGGGASRQPAQPAGTAPKKLTYKDQRDYDLLPDRIHALEAQIARDEAALHDPDLYTRDAARFAALTTAIEKARAERDAAEHRWLELAEQVEALSA